jgi:hypothetical protein
MHEEVFSFLATQNDDGTRPGYSVSSPRLT